MRRFARSGAKIRSSELRDRLQLVSQWAVRSDELSGILMQHRPRVIHFSGHGSTAGEILLVGPDGTARPVPSAVLVEMLRVLRGETRVVVLNACYAAVEAEAIVTVVDCAVGMSRDIGDQAGIVFASEFYQALGYGKSVRDALIWV